MNDAVLRQYGLNHPFSEIWEDADSVSIPQTTSSNELDALGTGQLIASILQSRGILRTDPTVFQKYSINSQSFNAREYIRDIHRKATQNDLRKGQEYLNGAVESKSGSLKVLVEDNFDRFVGSKRVIDNVYAQIANDFTKRDQAEPRLDRAKNTLNSTSATAAQVFEPIIETRRKSDRLRATLGLLEQFQEHFDLPSTLLQCIARNDNDALLKAYKRGLTMFKDVRGVLDQDGSLSTTERRSARILGRVWAEVERIMRTRELDTWRVLDEPKRVDNESTTKLANFLLELGVDTNPYYRAFTQQNLRIKESTTAALKMNRSQVEILRRKLQLQGSSSTEEEVEILRAYVEAENSPSETGQNIIQPQEVLHFWDAIESLVSEVWLSRSAEVVDNWRIFQEMTNTLSVKLLPNGPDGASRKFHTFTTEEREGAITKAEETIRLLSDSISDFFVAKPISKLAPIYSPVSASGPASPFSPISTVAGDIVPELPDLGDRPPGEFSFLPANVNSFGACLHLFNIQKMILSGVQDLHTLQISAKATEILKTMVNTVRERMIRAICELWQHDSDLLPSLENWKKISGREGGTSFSKTFHVVQKSIIDNVSRIAFSEKDPKSSGALLPMPSGRLVGNIRQQFHKNVYQTVNGLMSLTLAPPSARENPAKPTIEKSGEARKLLTLQNLRTIKDTIIIKLVQQFEHSFQTNLTEDLQSINQLLTSYDQKLFNSYLGPKMKALETTIDEAMVGIDWTRVPFPTRINDFASNLVLQLTVTHAEISDSGPLLIEPLITHLITTTFNLLTQGYSKVQTFSIGGILQITLDLEFLHYALTGPYFTPATVEEMDATLRLVEDRTDRELPVAGDQPEMKKVLGRGRKGVATISKVFRGEDNHH